MNGEGFDRGICFAVALLLQTERASAGVSNARIATASELWGMSGLARRYANGEQVLRNADPRDAEAIRSALQSGMIF